MDARPDSWRVLEGGPCDDETMLLVGELVELAVHQLRPPIGVRLARHHLADLGQGESDVAQEQHDADGAHRGFRIAALAGGSDHRADQPELVVIAERVTATPVRDASSPIDSDDQNT